MTHSVFTIRKATRKDIDPLNTLIGRSARALSTGFYTPAQLEAVTREVFGVDTQLIDDGTYYVAEYDGAMAACGGWGMRSTGCGGDQHKTAGERLLDPALEAAKIRAFFVAPHMARRGIGTLLMAHCEAAAAAAGFRELEMIATMPGVPLYLKLGFALVERFDLALSVPVPVALMRRPVHVIPT
jgi:GNAT superfamily N-acetyltransferase